MLEAELVNTVRGYECRYTPTIMSGPVFRFHHKGDDAPGRLQVSAGREGVSLDGHSGTLGPASPVTRGQVGQLLAIIQLAERVASILGRNDHDTHAAREIIHIEASFEGK